MNIKALSTCVLAAVATTASAQDPVYSVNIVGIQKVYATNTFTQVANPFNKQSLDIQDVIGPQLTGGQNYGNSDIVRVWDGSAYRSYFLVNYPDAPDFHNKWCYFDQNGDPQIATEQIPPGKGFWVQINSVTNVLSMVGDVEMAETKTLAINPGFNLISYPYSSEVSINSSDFGLNAAAGCSGGVNMETSDRLSVWIGQQYRTFFLVDYPDAPDFHDKWCYFNESGEPVVADYAINPGQAFWYRRKAGSPTMQWTTHRPY